MEPVSVLWSSRNWDANAQAFKRKSPAADGFTGPFEFLVTAEVEDEVTTVEREGDYSEIRFANLKDGIRLPAESELRVEVEASDKDGI